MSIPNTEVTFFLLISPLDFSAFKQGTLDYSDLVLQATPQYSIYFPQVLGPASASQGLHV